MKNKVPTIVSEEETQRGKFLITKVLHLSNGGKYEMVSRVWNRSAVAGIIRHKETGNIVLIDQFRYPVQKRVLELVAGVCDKDASLEQIMKEEVIEETGYGKVESILSLGEFTNSAGLTSETTHLFSVIVSGEKWEQQTGALEDIRVHEIPESEIFSFIAEKQQEWLLLDGKILAAIFLSKKHIEQVLNS